jgi:hypothetical protein
MKTITVTLPVGPVQRRKRYSREEGGYVVETETGTEVVVTLDLAPLAAIAARRAARLLSGRTVITKYGQTIAKARVTKRGQLVRSIEELAEIRVRDLGTIVCLEVLSARAENWLRENCQSAPHNWLGPSLCVEHRYADDIIAGAIAYGIRVDGDRRPA